MSCPCCGAEEVSRDKWETKFACGSKNVYDYGFDQSKTCKEKEEKGIKEILR